MLSLNLYKYAYMSSISGKVGGSFENPSINDVSFSVLVVKTATERLLVKYRCYMLGVVSLDCYSDKSRRHTVLVFSWDNGQNSAKQTLQLCRDCVDLIAIKFWHALWLEVVKYDGCLVPGQRQLHIENYLEYKMISLICEVNLQEFSLTWFVVCSCKFLALRLLG